MHGLRSLDDWTTETAVIRFKLNIDGIIPSDAHTHTHTHTLSVLSFIDDQCMRVKPAERCQLGDGSYINKQYDGNNIIKDEMSDDKDTINYMLLAQVK
jgi:hypothetical protein